MKIVTMKVLLESAEKNGIAIPAINVSNMETIKAVCESTEKYKTGIIMQISPIQFEMQKINYYEFVEMVKLLCKNFDIDIAIHLDHATEVKQCWDAIDAGFTSVMYDGSAQSYETNIENSRRVVLYAKDKGVTVEAELGKVGGTEGEASANNDDVLTDPNLAKEFVNRTGVDCLAVAIGNAHGFYKKEPKLDFDRLDKIYEETKIPLVLHGGTGITDEALKIAIKKGIKKINFFTEIDREFVLGFIKAYEENPSIYMMKAQEDARQMMMKKIDEKMKVCVL